MGIIDQYVKEEAVKFRNKMRYDLAHCTNAAIRAADRVDGIKYIREIFGLGLIQAGALYEHVDQGMCVSTFAW